MPDLHSDARTMDAERVRGRKSLGADLFDQAILRELLPDERVERFLDSATPVVAITVDRALTITGAFKPRAVSIRRPFSVKLGSNVPLAGREVELIGRGGESVKLHVRSRADLAALTEATTVVSGRVHLGSPEEDSVANDPATSTFPFLGTWQEAERVAWQHMRRLGFADAQITAGGADGGLDVSGHRAAAQVKHHAVPIGRPALQQLIGAAGHRPIRLFYSSSGYSPQAYAFGEAAGICLFEIASHGTVVPLNRAAKTLEMNTGHDLAADPLSRHLQKRRDSKEEQVSSRIEFLMGSTASLIASIHPLIGHPKRGIRKKAVADVKACESLLLTLQKARSSDRLMMERKSILKKAERDLNSIAQSRNLKPW